MEGNSWAELQIKATRDQTKAIEGLHDALNMIGKGLVMWTKVYGRVHGLNLDAPEEKR